MARPPSPPDTAGAPGMAPDTSAGVEPDTGTGRPEAPDAGLPDHPAGPPRPGEPGEGPGAATGGGLGAIGGGPGGGEVLPPEDTLIASQLATLRPGAFQLRAPNTMVQGTPELVRLRIAKDTIMPAAPTGPNEVVRTKPTRVGDSAQACLEGGEDFEIHAPGGEKCYTQLVTRGAENFWEWRVTPKNYGERLILVATVRALLAKIPGKTIYSDSVAVAVAVKPCPLYRLSCLSEWLTTVKGILTTLGGIVTMVVGWFGFKRRKESP